MGRLFQVAIPRPVNRKRQKKGGMPMSNPIIQLAIQDLLDLPKPIVIAISGDATFKVSLTKTPQTSWSSISALELLKVARRSYLRYGFVPALDAYDQKSWVYIVQVNYVCKCGQYEQHEAVEWFSFRFIPSSGVPEGVGDLKLCQTTTQPSLELLINKHLFQGAEVGDQLVSISKICTTHAWCKNSNGIVASHTGAIRKAFWLVNDYYFRFNQNAKFMTGIFQPVLVRALGNGPAAESFTPAWQMLGLAKASDVAINRKIISYAYPGYFLSVKPLRGLLARLVCEQQLAATWLDVEPAKLGELLTMTGQISAQSDLTGESLRELVDAEVPDEPELKIIEIAAWRRAITKSLDALGITFVQP